MAFGLGKFIGGIKFGVSMDTGKLNRDTKKARRMVGSFVGASTRMLGVYGGAAGVVATIAKAAGSYEQLNRSMNRSLSIMGDVSTTMRRDMTSAAIEVSKVTNASAKEAADAYFFLASAGLDAKQSLEALPKVAKFAQAGNFDLALATDLLTDAQSALGLTVKDTSKNIENMSRVSDVLIKANTLANATAQQFSEALTNKAGAALRLLNKDVEEGVAVLAAFADQGIKGAEAGTGFGIVLRDLQTKAIKFSGAFRDARVRVFDASGEMRNMADIISDLENRMVGLSDKAKKNFLLGLGFSDKSVSFVQALVGVSDQVREYEQALRGAGGATEMVAGKQLTNMEKATNRLSAAFTRLSQNMSPVVDKTASLLEKMSELMEIASQADRTKGKSATASRDALRQSKASFFSFDGFNEFARGASLFSLLQGGDIGPTSTAAQDNARQQRNRTRESIQKFQAEQFKVAVASAFRAAPKIFQAASNRLRETRRGQKGFFDDTVGRAFSGFRDGVSGLRSAALAKLAQGQLGFLDLQRKLAIAQGAKAPNLSGSGSGFRGELAFAQSGSAESFRQRARIRSQRDAMRLDKKRNTTLDTIAKNTANSVVLAPAGLA